jgi:hypothetical protein
LEGRRVFPQVMPGIPRGHPPRLQCETTESLTTARDFHASLSLCRHHGDMSAVPSLIYQGMEEFRRRASLQQTVRCNGTREKKGRRETTCHTGGELIVPDTEHDDRRGVRFASHAIINMSYCSVVSAHSVTPKKKRTMTGPETSLFCPQFARSRHDSSMVGDHYPAGRYSGSRIILITAPSQRSGLSSGILRFSSPVTAAGPLLTRNRIPDYSSRGTYRAHVFYVTRFCRNQSRKKGKAYGQPWPRP